MRVNDLIESAKSAFAVKGVNVSEGHAVKMMLLAMACVMAFEPSIVFAEEVAATAPWDGAVTAIFGTLTGTLGKTIATLAVIVLGIMAMAGKLAWDTAIKVVIGIVMMFSAATIVNWIAPTMGGIAS